jgi:hypothetical protein
MSVGDKYLSAEDFLRKMDSGEFSGSLRHELTKLSREQLEELARILIERNVAPRGT